jgi:hypothetical protein
MSVQKFTVMCPYEGCGHEWQQMPHPLLIGSTNPFAPFVAYERRHEPVCSKCHRVCRTMAKRAQDRLGQVGLPPIVEMWLIADKEEYR